MNINTLFILSCLVLLGCSQNVKEGNLKTENSPSKIEETKKTELVATDSITVNPSIVAQTENIPEKEQPQLNKQPSDYESDVFLVDLEGIDYVYEMIAELDNVALKYQFETSISIINDGTHCDLYGWNIGFSEWIDISHRIEEDGYFRCYWQTSVDSSYYPKMDLEEIKSYMKEHCDSSRYELIKDFDSINSFNITVEASTYNFKVSGNDPVTKEKIEKTFNLQIVMGC